MHLQLELSRGETSSQISSKSTTLLDNHNVKVWESPQTVSKYIKIEQMHHFYNLSKNLCTVSDAMLMIICGFGVSSLYVLNWYDSVRLLLLKGSNSLMFISI